MRQICYMLKGSSFKRTEKQTPPPPQKKYYNGIFTYADAYKTKKYFSNSSKEEEWPKSYRIKVWYDGDFEFVTLRQNNYSPISE